MKYLLNASARTLILAAGLISLSCGTPAFAQEAAFHWSLGTKDVGAVVSQKAKDLPNLLGTGRTGEFHLFGGIVPRTTEPIGGASVTLPFDVAANAQVFFGPSLVFQEGTPTGAGVLFGARFKPSPSETLSVGLSPAHGRVSFGLTYTRRL